MPSNLAIQKTGDWVGGLLTGGRRARLDGWLTILQIYISLAAPLLQEKKLYALERALREEPVM
eukprot:1157567-Pelagomonas_calceolata.AAC.5